MSIKRHIATGTAAIASTLTPTSDFRLKEVRLHLSAAGGAVGVVNFTITLDSALGAAYDVVLKTVDMTAVVDYHWQPELPLEFVNGDALVFAYANGSSRTYGLEVIYETV